MMIDQRAPQPMGDRQMMGSLAIPGRMPKSESIKDQEMLSAIFGSLPQGSMLKALEAIGIQVREPQEALAEDQGQNTLPSWNDRRIMLAGQDKRGPVWNRDSVLERPAPINGPSTAPYLAPNFDSGMGPLGVASNFQGGM